MKENRNVIKRATGYFKLSLIVITEFEISKYNNVSNEFYRASYLMLDTSFTDCIFVISHTTRHSITEFTFEYEHSYNKEKCA